MTFPIAIASCFSQYATFHGRAVRGEYWYFVLFLLVCDVTATLVDAMVLRPGIGPVGMIVTVATFLPGLAVLVRRLHDIDRTGWWVLIGLIPLAGVIVLIVFACTPGTEGPNRFGPGRSTT